MKTSKTVIFSDIDGTIIDDKYSLKNTQSIISEILKKQVLFVLCSSKTRAEIEFYRDQLSIKDPFISENGAAIFIPKGYFDFSFDCTKKTRKFDVIEFGIVYSEIRKKIRKIEKNSSFKITGFGDMTVEEVAIGTGLPFELAALAKEREYSEPCLIQGKNEEEFSKLLRNEGLRYEKGKKYYNLIGNHDKGKAVSRLKELYATKFGVIKSFAVGNDQNDFSMLNISDCSFFIEKKQRLKTVWTRVDGNLPE
jgi:mannosyl-3-phosphoglycerate phosphatase